MNPSVSVRKDYFFQVQVRSLGCVELREDELTPENSSKAVNKCIIQLAPASDGDRPPPPASKDRPRGLWGDGRELTLELNEGSLKLIDPCTSVVLNAQPIHSIRVWGVGRDNGRDFAYVARDRNSRRHLCHVFRCDLPARAIANALRDICKKILIERSLAQSSSKFCSSSASSTATSTLSSSSQMTKKSQPNPNPTSNEGKENVRNKLHKSSSGPRRDRMRPTSLGSKLQTKSVPTPESFPTPMEEPRKTIAASFLGTLEVSKPCGIDVIHGAIDTLMETTVKSQWKNVSVAVAPSTITIAFPSDPKTPSLDCRVRFLSFLGIGDNQQQCAFIMHTAQDTFVAYVFHCEPSAGPLCKTVEAACKLRYQKCLDARPQRAIVGSGGSGGGNLTRTRNSIGATIKNMFGAWKGGSGTTTAAPS